jgi:antirestriction protein ArdC
VFNASQVDGVSIAKPETVEKPFNSVDAIEQRVSKLGVKLQHGGDRAFFSPSHDLVQMPERTAFDNEASYYATLLHELTHWTSEKSRCDRDLSKGRFGNPDYAFEELVAELGAAFLCGDYQIQGELRHAGYIANWLTCLKNDNKAIFKASALAQKAADYINTYDASKPLAIAA